MATTASTFRRPKNKGGTRTSIGVEEGRGNRKYHSMGDTRNEYRKGRAHKGAVEVSQWIKDMEQILTARKLKMSESDKCIDSF